jgi:arginyl-tRNA synthetase
MLCEKTGGKALSTPLRTIYYVVYAHTRLCTMIAPVPPHSVLFEFRVSLASV